MEISDQFLTMFRGLESSSSSSQNSSSSMISPLSSSLATAALKPSGSSSSSDSHEDRFEDDRDSVSTLISSSSTSEVLVSFDVDVPCGVVCPWVDGFSTPWLAFVDDPIEFVPICWWVDFGTWYDDEHTEEHSDDEDDTLEMAII